MEKEKRDPSEECSECGIKVSVSKHGRKSMFIDGRIYVAVEKKDVTIDRLKPTRKVLDEVGEILVDTRNRLGNCSQEFHEIMDAQKEIDLRLIKISEVLAKLDMSHDNQ